MFKRPENPAPDEPLDDGTCQVLVVDEDRVRRARAALLAGDLALDVAELFKVLSHPTRVGILRALAEETLCVCELAQVLGLSVSGVSHQLRDLRRLCLVEYRMDGKLAWYSIRDPFVLSLLAQGIDHVSDKARAP